MDLLFDRSQETRYHTKLSYCRRSNLDHLMRTDEYAWTLLAWWLCGFVTCLKRFPSSGDRIAGMRATFMVQPGPAILSQPGNLSPKTAQGTAPRLKKWKR